MLPATGGLTPLPPDGLARVPAGVGAAVEAMGGAFTVPLTTLAVTAARTATA